MIPEAAPFDAGDRFRDAARAYLVYGIVYWVGGVYLALHGVGVRGAMQSAGVSWIVLGLIFVIAIPYVLRDQINWSTRSVFRWRFLHVIVLIYGCVILTFAFIRF